MSKKLKDNDEEKEEKKVERRRKILFTIGMICAILSGILNLLMIIAGDFDSEAFTVFILSAYMAFMFRKK